LKMIFERFAIWVTFYAAFASARLLDLNEDYKVEVDVTGFGENASILLNITANTKGYIGFGIGPNPNMTGADLFIGGVNNTMLYGKDYYATDNETPAEDCESCQSWKVLSGNETNDTTTLLVQRLLDTKDNVTDIEIKNSSIFVLWSYGEFDAIVHHRRRGFRLLNLFTADDSVPTTTPNPVTTPNITTTTPNITTRTSNITTTTPNITTTTPNITTATPNITTTTSNITTTTPNITTTTPSASYITLRKSAFLLGTIPFLQMIVHINLHRPL